MRGWADAGKGIICQIPKTLQTKTVTMIKPNSLYVFKCISYVLLVSILYTVNVQIEHQLGLYFLPEGLDLLSIQARPLFEPGFYFLGFVKFNTNRKMAANILIDSCALLIQKVSLGSTTCTKVLAWTPLVL